MLSVVSRQAFCLSEACYLLFQDRPFVYPKHAICCFKTGLMLLQFAAIHNLGTHRCQSTLCTMRRATGTHIASMQQQPVVRIRHIGFWNVAHERLFHLQWRVIGFGYKPQPMAHTIDMRVYRHSGFAESHRLYHVRGLTPHPRKRHKV